MLSRCYRLALRLLPRDVRVSAEEEIVGTFESLCDDADSAAERVLLLLRCLLALPRVAVLEHLEALSRTRRRRRRKRMWGWTQDLRYAARTLVRTPAFTVGSVLLLALGVGAVTSIFTLVDNILLRQLPYPEADRLVFIEDGSHSGPFFHELTTSGSVEQWAGALWNQTNLTGTGEPQMLDVLEVSTDYFSLFGAAAAEGRLIQPDDFEAADAVVLSYRTWSRVFGADEAVIGSTIRLDGAPVSVVGVAERSFSAPEVLGGAPDLWRPLDWSRPELQQHGFWMLEIAGRLAPGATPADAEAEIAGLVSRLEPLAPEQYRDRDGNLRTLPVTALRDVTVRGVRVGLRLLLGAVTLLLVIACSNVAHLFLARGLARAPEIAVRRALGAGTAPLVRQLLVEGLIVAMAGGTLGVLLAAGAVRGLLALMPATLPRADALSLDLRVVAFAAGLSALTTVLFGLTPALRSVHTDAADQLGGRRRSTARHGVAGLRGGLVIAEVALSMMLVTGAGVLIHSFLEVNRQETGIDAAGVWVIPLNPTGLENGDQYRQTMEPIRAALAASPGVESATYGLGLPFSFTGGQHCCWRTGFTNPDAEDPEARVALWVHPVSRDYVSTLGIRLRRGRVWQPHEASSRLHPALVPESTAAKLFGSSGVALGRQLDMGERGRVEIVGVIGDVRYFGLDQSMQPEIYVPVELVPFGEPLAAVAVRFEGAAPTDVGRQLRAAVWSVAPDLPVPSVISMEQQIASSTAMRRFDSILFSTFGVVALLLAAGGLYGTLLYAVAQRRREIGIRLALGARRHQVEGQILSSGMRVAGAGVLIGLVGSWMTARFLDSRIWGIDARDPTALIGAAALLLATAAAAGWLPAWRAAATDPAETLRAE